jgi:hypothetical protein
VSADSADVSAARGPVFTDERDAEVRDALATAAIEKVKKGSGGRSLAFKLSLAGGVQGYFKPEQTFAANWNSELAAYYLDRALELGRTPPVAGRRIAWARLSPVVGDDPRLKEVVVRNGVVRGSVVWWVPEKLIPVELPADWPGWLRVERSMGVSPYQSPADYGRQRRRAQQRLLAPPAPSFADRPAELSDLILFDYLIGNLDRWGSSNTNVRVLESSKRLIYLDNANGFGKRYKPSPLLSARLSAVQRFRRTTIAALRALDVKALERSMAKDPLAPILTAGELASLEERRQTILEHVAELERRHGSSVLSL